MVSIEFHLRASKKGADHPGKLFVRVIARRRTASFTLPYRLYPYEWDEREKKVVTNQATPKREKELVAMLPEIERDRRLLCEIAESAGELAPDAAAWIIESFKMQRTRCTLDKMASFFADELRAAAKERTARAYMSTFSAFSLFLGGKDLILKEITGTLLKDFQKWLLDKGRKLNTVSFYLRNLRAIYNKAVAKGWAPALPDHFFKEVYTSVAPSLKRALLTHELQQLEGLHAKPDKLKSDEQNALSLFLFAFHGRGISFVDLAFLKKEDIRDGKIYYKRRKTGTPLVININHTMKKIIHSFKSKTAGSPYLFPLIAPDAPSHYTAYTVALGEQNKRLGRIARIAGLSGKLTTHMARHTWATIAKKENVAIWVISEALGHRSLETTYIYLDSFDSPVIDQAARKVSAAVRKKAG